MSEYPEKLRVMIVDDEPDLAFAVAQVLKFDYETVLANNGLEALERIDRYEPDIIIMDVNMPVLDGFDTTRAIRKNASFLNLPILFLTAQTDNQSLREGLMSGADMYLNKPFVTDDLRHNLQQMVKTGDVQRGPKKFTLDELQRLYCTPSEFGAGAGDTQNSSRTSPGRPKTLSEQMADAAEPKLRVLAVDDDQDIINFVRICLQDDYEVITTTDSETAPDKIIAYQPDILLLDIMMPKLNGFHLSYLIRLNKRLRGAKIIFISSRSDRESMERAFRLGASEYLEKPFTPDQLRRRIFDVTRKPDFHRSKKRVTYTEIRIREGID